MFRRRVLWRAGRGDEGSATPLDEADGETQLWRGWPLIGQCAAIKVNRKLCPLPNGASTTSVIPRPAKANKRCRTAS